MKRIVAAATIAAAVALSAVGSAGAAVTVVSGTDSNLTLGSNGSPYAEMLHENFDPASNSITEKSKPTGYYVSFTAPSGQTLHGSEQGNNGYAQLDGPFSNILITPNNSKGGPFLAGFTDIGFTLDEPQKITVGTHQKNLVEFSFNIDVNYLNDGTETFLVSDFDGLSNNNVPSNNSYDINRTGSKGIQSIYIYNLHGAYKDGSDIIPVTGPLQFDDMKHVSFNAVTGVGTVPEPATWGMMLLGFFGTGALVRSRRRPLGAA
jgi:hypothetical protein